MPNISDDLRRRVDVGRWDGAVGMGPLGWPMSRGIPSEKLEVQLALASTSRAHGSCKTLGK